MTTLHISAVRPPPAQWAAEQAIALLAVDGIHPSREGLVLLESISAGDMTYEQAIQAILDRATRYASRPA